jgi:hypothetical protein
MELPLRKTWLSVHYYQRLGRNEDDGKQRIGMKVIQENRHHNVLVWILLRYPKTL